LGGAAGGAGGPLEGGGGEQANHAVVGVGGDEAVGAEGEDEVRALGADGLDEMAGDGVEVGAVEGSVGVVENLAVRDSEVAAGDVELLAAHGFEVFIVGRATAVGGALSGGEADDGALDTGFGI